jgi:hypothetical protein
MINPPQKSASKNAQSSAILCAAKAMEDEITIYVLLGAEKEVDVEPARFFIVENGDVAQDIHCPPGCTTNGFLPLKAVEKYENNWDAI